MIIDAHAHLDARSVRKSIKLFLESMTQSGIDKSAIFSGFGGSFAELKIVLEAVKKSKGKLFGIGYIMPEDKFQKNNQTTLQVLRTGGIKGVKFYLGYGHFYPNDFSLLGNYYRAIQKSGYPAIFHTGDTYNGYLGARLKYAHPLAIDDVAVEFPKLKIVIAHLGNPWITDAAAVMYKNANVYADISGWVYRAFDVMQGIAMTRKFLEAKEYLGNSDRILFGTDYPISNRDSYVVFVNNLPIPEEEKQQIFYKNAQKLFRI